MFIYAGKHGFDWRVTF